LKEVENFFYAGKFKDANQVITRRSVIREHAGGQRFDGAEEGVEHIHEENKEEGGERAALFNASIEVNTSRFGTWEGSVTVGVSEKHSNSLDDVGGEADLGEEGKDDFVVAAVKGLGKVIEDKVIMFPSFKGAIEGFIVKEDVVIHLSPSEEAKLVKRDNVWEGVDDDGMNDGGDQAIIRVGHNNGSGVLNDVKAFFGNKVEEAPVEIFTGAGFARAHVLDTVEKDGARDVDGVPIDTKGDAVRTGRRVVRLENDLFDKL
jgi:hypothetical protein